MEQDRGQDQELFSPDLVFLDLGAADRAALFDVWERRLQAGGYVRPGWRAALEEREERYPTGLAFPTCGAALPHVDPAFIARPYIAVTRLARPVAFRAMADPAEEVAAEFAFNLGVVRDAGQVAVLQRLMELLADEDAVAGLRAARTEAELLAVIARRFS